MNIGRPANTGSAPGAHQSLAPGAPIGPGAMPQQRPGFPMGPGGVPAGSPAASATMQGMPGMPHLPFNKFLQVNWRSTFTSPFLSLLPETQG